MEYIFRALWAAILAWVIVWFLGWLDANWGIFNNSMCRFILDGIWSLGNPKKILFFTLFLLLALTSFGKTLGNWVFIALTVAIFFAIAVLVICLLALLLNWAAGFL